jgi:hypothetical protein
VRFHTVYDMAINSIIGVEFIETIVILISYIAYLIVYSCFRQRVLCRRNDGNPAIRMAHET